jgi:hypothetical protein
MARYPNHARTRFRCGVAAASLGLAALVPAAADAECRQALVFALDVSGSVDDMEYRQQLEGLAAALEDPTVVGAILGDPGAPMTIAAFEWSSREHASLIVDWTMLESESDVLRVTGLLRGWERSSAPLETGLGSGLEMAAALLQRVEDCWEHTVDVSADGKNNDGPSPKSVHGEGTLADATVNALVIGTLDSGTPEAEAELEDIRAYLETNVMRGPGSFVAVAQSYEDYTRAMRQKLLKEIAAPLVRPMPGGTPG